MQAAWIAAWAGIIGSFGGALLGGAVGVVGTWLVTRDTSRAQQRASIQGMILKTIEMAMQYPTLEKRAYCHAYPNPPGDVNGKERYENYCCFVFNVLVQAWAFCKGKSEKVSDLVLVDEILRAHYKWWEHDRENLHYSPQFRQFINGRLDELRKKGEIQ